MHTVLVIDDDTLHGRYVVALLERLGMTAVSVDSARKAESALKDGQFSFVLTDILMPDMDGIELARSIARLQPGLLVIGMTGATIHDAKIYQRALSIYGVRFLLQKPFGAAEMTQALERAGILHAPAGQPRTTQDEAAHCQG